MSRNPNDLHPDILDAYHAFMSACKMHKIDVLVTCTYRSTEEQAELYTQGRTMPGRIVTNAKPGESKHNFKLANGAPASKAFDVVPLRNGKPIWGTGGNGIDDDPTDDDTDDLELWERVGALGEMCGLSWAGRWTKLKEYPHFEVA